MSYHQKRRRSSMMFIALLILTTSTMSFLPGFQQYNQQFSAAVVVAAVVPPALAQENDFEMDSEEEEQQHITHNPGEASPDLNNETLAINTVFEGLEFPTAMAFLAENDILVLEKDSGRVQRIIDGELQDEPVLDVAVANNDERGLLGIAVLNEDRSSDIINNGNGEEGNSGDVADEEEGEGGNDNRGSEGRGEEEPQQQQQQPIYVYLYFTESGGGEDGDDWREGIEPAGNRLYRYIFENDRLQDGELLLDLPATPGPRYNGGPVLIGPDNNVYVVIGDVDHHETEAQNFEDGPEPDGTSGILRITPDGEAVVEENGEAGEGGILGDEDLLNLYYAYGIRQSFGMDFDPVNGTLWDTENGPESGDEINLVEPGFNSGWADVQGMAAEQENFDPEEDLVDFDGRGEYSDPEFVWNIPTAPTAIKFFNSSALGEEYQNDMFVGDFNNGFLYHFELNQDRDALALEGEDLEDRVAGSNAQEELEQVLFGTGFGGITDIETGPGAEGDDNDDDSSGYLYVLSFHDEQGTIFQIAPENEEEDVE